VKISNFLRGLLGSASTTLRPTSLPKPPAD
jgi:hypothetical protein